MIRVASPAEIFSAEKFWFATENFFAVSDSDLKPRENFFGRKVLVRDGKFFCGE
ncbi:MAG: hypothetical protein IJR52_03705 [Selenomonadaceae bacterium]|nr:hypothetical protein [Selenomonadaceae bacterium]MBQ9496665.1 hypothetical protein [Selenomonadaceae bacterium]